MRTMTIVLSLVLSSFLSTTLSAQKLKTVQFQYYVDPDCKCEKQVQLAFEHFMRHIDAIVRNVDDANLAQFAFTPDGLEIFSDDAHVTHQITNYDDAERLKTLIAAQVYRIRNIAHGQRLYGARKAREPYKIPDYPTNGTERAKQAYEDLFPKDGT